jgi:hypothetical protein
MKKYLKVTWIHDFPNEPILLWSELDSDRYEIRKVEIFADGRAEWASEQSAAGGSILGELPVPSAEEIASDPQFLAQETIAEEFENAWSCAVS